MHGGMRLWWYEGAPRGGEQDEPTSTRPPTNGVDAASSVDNGRTPLRVVWRMRLKPLAIERGAGRMTPTD